MSPRIALEGGRGFLGKALAKELIGKDYDPGNH